MNIKAILSKINSIENVTLKENAHDSLSIVNTDVFYVQPEFKEIQWKLNSQMIVISAPGASGKSQLAKYLSNYYKSIYWDLSSILLGENSFVGTLFKAVDDIAEYYNKLRTGKTILLLDAFDEAEMVSGRAGIECFLKELISETKNSVAPSVIMFARTDSADFISHYLESNGVVYSKFEIGFLSESNAKSFIKQDIARRGASINTTVDSVINQQFALIKEILNPDEANSFLGYAPVLQALSSSFDQERNTIKLLISLKDRSHSGTDIVFGVLSDLLNRENEKVKRLLRERWKTKYPDYSDWDHLYTNEEQIVRIVEYILYNEVVQDGSCYAKLAIPDELQSDYFESIKLFLPQNPFIQDYAEESGMNFTGPAFREYALSFLLSIDDYEELAFDYINEIAEGHYIPSRLLIDFCSYHENEAVSGKSFYLLYDSYKSKEDAFQYSKVEFTDDVACFSLFDKNSNELIDEIAINVKTDRLSLTINRLTNSFIDTENTIIIGTNNGNVRLCNSSLFSDRIIFNSNSVSIESEGQKECTLVSNQNVLFKGSKVPQFDVRIESGDSNLVRISFPNLSSFHRLKPFSFNYEKEDRAKYLDFKRFINKLMSCVRGHKKDTPAKDKEFIDNIIIGESDFKKNVMDFLLNKHIFYVDTDPKQSHLYKLDLGKTKEYGINWQNSDSGLSNLFNEFSKRMTS